MSRKCNGSVGPWIPGASLHRHEPATSSQRNVIRALTLGLFLSRGFHIAIELVPVLGVILLFEALNLVLLLLIKDTVSAKLELGVVVLTGLMCVGSTVRLCHRSCRRHGPRRERVYELAP